MRKAEQHLRAFKTLSDFGFPRGRQEPVSRRMRALSGKIKVSITKQRISTSRQRAGEMWFWCSACCVVSVTLSQPLCLPSLPHHPYSLEPVALTWLRLKSLTVQSLISVRWLCFAICKPQPGFSCTFSLCPGCFGRAAMRNTCRPARHSLPNDLG